MGVWWCGGCERGCAMAHSLLMSSECDVGWQTKGNNILHHHITALYMVEERNNPNVKNYDPV